MKDVNTVSNYVNRNHVMGLATMGNIILEWREK